MSDVYIAGRKTCDDWKTFSKALTPGREQTQWQEAFDSYFHARLALRYLNPIKVLQDDGTFQGEGFSIAAIQCTLVEFLESTVQGRSYRYWRPGFADPPLDPICEYSGSNEVFVAFLTTRVPFSSNFDAALALDFYKGVRCGLLHEAQTKRGWTISAKGPTGKVISATDKILYRDNFQDGILKFVEWYKQALLTDVESQRTFIRKFNSLCQP